MPEIDQRRAVRALTLLDPRLRYHRAAIQGAERIPASGGAVIVSNHGRLDLDAAILVRLILRKRGRLVRMLIDHMWSRVPVAGRLFTQAGSVDGNRDNAARLLSAGELVLAYPGGVREIMESCFGHESLDWTGRRGFARAAIDAGVPVIPVAGVGVNNGFRFVSSGRFLGSLLFRRILGLGPEYAGYRNPLVIGLLPIPLPLSIAVGLPWPCRVTYYVGEPLKPPAREGATMEETERFVGQVEDAMWGLLEAHGRPGQRPGLRQRLGGSEGKERVADGLRG